MGRYGGPGGNQGKAGLQTAELRGESAEEKRDGQRCPGRVQTATFILPAGLAEHRS